MIEIKVDQNIAGQRIDRFVRKFLDQANLSFIYKMLRKKNILVNDKKVKEKYILQEGDMIKFYLADQTISKFQSPSNEYFNKIDLDILYEDPNIILVNKAQGLLSHSDGKDEKNLIDGIVRYLIDSGKYKREENPTFTPALANRLDKNTSGLILAGKNLQALRELNRAFKASDIKRHYIALVKGRLEGQNTLIDKIDRKSNRLSQISNLGKEIITRYRSIAGSEEISLVELELVTGRTHQIRSHMAHIGHPIIGDPKYGDLQINKIFKEKYGIKYQLLHCYRLELMAMEEPLEYLNDQVFTGQLPNNFIRVLKGENLWENL